MITLEEFFRVQSIISKKRHAQPHRREREEFPLRGTVRCPECHSYLTGGISRGNGGRYSYYHCYKKNCLRRKSYSPADVHGEFQGFLDQLAPTKQLISKVGDLIVELAHEANEPKAKQRARDEAELRHVKTQLHELFRLKLDGLLTDDEFLAQKSSLVSHQSTLEAAIVDLVMDENSIRAKLAEITDPLVSLRKTWDALPIQLKRRFKQFLLGFGYLHRSIRTAETPILFKLFHPFSTSNARLVAPTGGSWNQIVQEIEEFAELIREWRGEKTAV